MLLSFLICAKLMRGEMGDEDKRLVSKVPDMPKACWQNVAHHACRRIGGGGQKEKEFCLALVMKTLCPIWDSQHGNV